METLFSLHVVSSQHVEASPLKPVGGLTRILHHQLQENINSIHYNFCNVTIFREERISYDDIYSISANKLN